ncbi:MAG: hypothetical protein R3211_07460 [Balneolaceae bacterium]|nr:hypothetical protein [Balneolaceae bacterium]
MKKILAIAFICVSLSLIPDSSEAQDQGFGIGAVINGPTGISYKAWIDQRVAIGGAATFTVGDGTDLFYTHADVLVHNNSLIKGGDLPGSLSLYYGGGVALSFFNDSAQDENVDIRAPIGTVYGLEQAPLDLFFELVPTLRVVESTRFFLNGAVGVRFYLN